MAWRRQQTGISVVRKKRLDLLLPFGTEYRTGAVQQAATRAHQGPKRPQQAGLQGGKLGNVAFAAQPSHVRVAPNDAGGGTGCVQQDGTERFTTAFLLPPVLR